MNLDELEQELAEAEERVDENLRRVLSETPVSAALREDIRRRAVLLKQRAATRRRELAQHTGDEHAVWIDIGVRPEAAVSGAVLLQSESKCFLLFNTNRGPVAGAVPIAVLEFRGIHKTQFGIPNDEALAGHPLHDRGLSPYDVFEIVNSSWLAAEERRNRVRFPDSRFDCTHYILSFHDSTFECLAEDLNVVVETRPLEDLLMELTRRSDWMGDGSGSDEHGEG